MAIKKVIIITDNDDFELFKSNLCQSIKLLDPQEAIEEITNSHTIEKFFKEKNYCKSFYLVAMVNYLSNKYGLNMNIHTYDKYKMKNIIYPRGIEMMSRLLKNNDIKEKALKNAEKEFLQFNICEGDIENVY